METETYAFKNEQEMDNFSVGKGDMSSSATDSK